MPGRVSVVLERVSATTANDLPAIQVILGSTREGRFGDVVARWFYSLASERNDLHAELIDLREWPLPFFNEPRPPMAGGQAAEAEAWASKVAEAHGYVFVTPEYNFGPPAVLKNALDHVYDAWNNKPVAFVGYGGPAGAARAIQQLRLSTIELQMAPIRASVVIPLARRAFGERGKPLEERHEAAARRVLDQLVWWARALKAARLETAVLRRA